MYLINEKHFHGEREREENSHSTYHTCPLKTGVCHFPLPKRMDIAERGNIEYVLFLM